jgi:hypothetical protein
MWLSPAQGKATPNSAPFAVVALAGHVNMGNGAYCECGTANCICDPGEVSSKSADATTDQLRENNSTTLVDANAANGFDPSAGALILMLALIVVLRMRF